MQRLKEPVHADRCSESDGGVDRIPVRHRLPQKWTLTQPRNLRRFRQFGGRFVHERTVTFCKGESRCGRALPAPPIPRLAGTISGTVRTRSGVS